MIASDSCLLALAKNGELLTNENEVYTFLQTWYGVDKYTKAIWACIQANSSHGTLVPTKAERKTALKAARASKKAKYMDDPAVAETARLDALRDEWLIQRGKSSPAIKARLKKAASEEKKQQSKLEKARENAQQNDIRRLAISNRQMAVGAFKDILLNPHTEASSEPVEIPPVIHTPASMQAITSMQMGSQISKANKQAVGTKKTNNLLKRSRLRSLTPPPVQMELIRPGKRKVRIPPNAVESTPPKRMRAI